MSDGTLRSLGVLTAVFQQAGVRLVGIEEPELALHPGAASVLRECLVLASKARQIVVTSHSPELLDDEVWRPEHLRAVQVVAGATTVAALDEPTRSALRDRLYTAGELLRAGQLLPDLAAVPKGTQLRLFEDAP
jgi:predicted ATPase